jgi:hypothetical protein
MYGNSPIGGDAEPVSLTAEERQELRRDLSTLTARMRDLLPPEFVVGSEITSDDTGPRATLAVQPPLGGVVSADYSPESGDVAITDDERDDIVHSLAASAAIQVKQAMGDDPAPFAQ